MGWISVLYTDPSTGVPEVDWLTRIGSLGILAYGVVAFMRGWIVSGAAAKERLSEMKGTCDEMRAQRDKALDLVYKHAEISTRALELGEKK